MASAGKDCMAGFCQILTAATLVFHLMVGCCSHHAHACQSDCGCPSHHDAAREGQCPEGDSHHSHHGADECLGSKCSFIATSRTVTDSPVQPVAATFAVALGDMPAPARLGAERSSRIADHLLWPVRLHLANQVLLI